MDNNSNTATCEWSTEQMGFSGGRDAIEMLSAPPIVIETSSAPTLVCVHLVHLVHSDRPRDLKSNRHPPIRSRSEVCAEASHRYLTASRPSEYQEAARDTRSDTFSSLRCWTSSVLPRFSELTALSLYGLWEPVGLNFEPWCWRCGVDLV